ncbi:type I polyketide synthase, partial [Streptomyces sp. PT12]|uniref:type I polyketide synthase n=1 Tax=Streptomyces sp. PT12 TaxID=1510197 RepID=UPI000DE527F5
GHAVDLPTYAFQHRRYWLVDESTPADAALAGLGAADHPLLGAAMSLASGAATVLTGRWSLASHPWLADHAVRGTVLVPGTAFVELATRASDEVGCGLVEELTLSTPLLMPETGAVDLQVVVGAPDGEGRRPLDIYARPSDAGPDTAWTPHGTGTLADDAPAPAFDLRAWPPDGATRVPLDGFYPALAERGYDYGPAFQGLRAVWRRGDETFAEVAADAVDPVGYLLHPALLDTGLHAALATTLAGAGVGERGNRLPFSWRGVAVHATGAGELRVRLAPAGPDGTDLTVTVGDAKGAPVATVDTLATRELPHEHAAVNGGGATGDALFHVDWTPAPAKETTAAPAVLHPVELLDERGLLAALDRLAAQRPLPDAVMVACPSPGEATGPAPKRVRAVLEPLTRLLRHWLADERFAASRLVVTTRGAVPAGTGDADPLQAPVWGLVRAARAEHPDRLVLADLDPAADTAEAADLGAGLALDEPEFALRDGAVLVPRLARADTTDDRPPAAFGTGAVLVTGAAGTLGALVARHLVTDHGVRELILVGRSGVPADQIAELAELGATVHARACDAADRDALAALIADARAPLTGVVHAAGALDDGLIADLTPDRLDAVLRPKADAAWHLHELTRDADLSAFVLFSSASGVLGNAGQANYAAANAFLDALAHRRRTLGLPAQSLAWGLWAPTSALTGRLGDADLARLTRLGVLPMTAPQGLALLDAALACGAPALVPARLDLTAPRDTEPRALLRGLVRARPRRRTAATTAIAATITTATITTATITTATSGDADDGLARRLAAMDERAALAHLGALVRAEVATVLGHAELPQGDAERPFRDLGFDSLTAVELRNRLSAATGLRLPATLVFDHPRPRALVHFLRAQLAGGQRDIPDAPTPGAAAPAEEPIAIVAMSCRYPGGVETPEDLWRLVASGADVIDEAPRDRGWDLASRYDPTPGVPGRTYVTRGGFLRGHAEFDAELFGVSPREALAMDPQQRLLLQTAWEAFERAGLDPSSLRGSRTGVFAGLMYHDYGTRLRAVPEDVEGYLGNGTAGSVASGRVAYTFGLEGPAVTVDTACSSSLVALHLAIGALRRGECSLALAGGVTVMSSVGTFLEFSRQRAIAPDARCKAFSAEADGAGFAEGAGLLLVERLSDARRNGHPVLAVVRGSAVNQDGASNGMTAPSGPAQQGVIRAALADARLTPGQVDAVEAHGTGTPLGDPIEAGALLATYGQDRKDQRPLAIGTLKSNIGHAQAAAGVGGVIKMVMALREELLPPTLHAERPSPHIDWAAGSVRLLTDPTPWPRGDAPRRAGVSSFGVSGTNAHVILEEAPPAQEVTEPEPEGADPVVPWVLSAATPTGLRAQAERLRDHLARHPGPRPLDIAHSLATTRAALEHRAVVTGADLPELLAGLEALTLTGAVSRGRGKVAFLFPGQGAQRPGTGRELHAAFPAFAEAFDAALAALGASMDAERLRAALWGDDPDALDRTEVAQPALFAVGVALARLLESWGVVPELLAGHSVGELAAAHLAGVIDLPTAARLVAARGRLMGQLDGDAGEMVAVEAPEAEARAHLVPGVDLAAVNGPTSVVLSGERHAVRQVADHFARLGRRTKRLRVSHAFHSPLMEPALDALHAVAADLTYAPPRVPLISGLTGGPVGDEACRPEFWVRHVREPVRFGDAARALYEAGARTFLDLGSPGDLAALAHRALDGLVGGVEAASLPVLRGPGAPGAPGGPDRPRGPGGERRAVIATAGALFTRGVPVDFAPLLAGGRRVELPTYAFQRTRYWLEPDGAAGDVAAVGLTPADHPLLGAAVGLPESEGHLFTGRLALGTHGWLADHAVHGATLLPGTAFLELALHAGRSLDCARVAELTLETPLVLPERGGVHLRLTAAAPDADGARQLTVHSRPDDDQDAPWTRHATGRLAPDAAEPPDPADPRAPWPPPGAKPVPLTGLHDRLDAAGLSYGPAFRGLHAVWRRGHEILAEVMPPEESAPDTHAFGLHPALLDAALRAVGAAAGPEAARLPFSWNGVTLHTAGAAALRVRLTPEGPGAWSVRATDARGVPVLSADALATRPVTAARIDAARGGARPELLQMEWAELPVPPPGDAAFRCADIGGLRRALDAGAPLPPVVHLPLGGRPVEETLFNALTALKEWLADRRFAASRLVLVTSGAVATGPDDELTDPAGAAVRGLARSAATEHPGRLVIADVDDPGDAEGTAKAAALAAASGELEVAVRAGRLLAPRLAPAPARPAPAAPAPDDAPDDAPNGALTAARWDPEGTVLITGAGGAIGRHIARHLATAHGVRHLLLLGRRGAATPGADALTAQLAAAGASTTWAACDAADRGALAAALAAVPPDRPLRGVVHAAGVLADGVITALTGERLAEALRPKVAAARHLDDLTADAKLSAFVLFSSAAGLFGSAGQGGYAAANAYLDALATRRRARGLPGLSLAWGLWDGGTNGAGPEQGDGAGGMGATLGATELRRLTRTGVGALTPTEALTLFDAACASTAPVLAPLRLEPAALRAAVRAGEAEVPPLLRALVPIPGRVTGTPRAQGPRDLTDRLAGLPEAERDRVVLEAVRRDVAAVLGHGRPETVEPQRAFKDVGFDSLAAVELRNRLSRATGLTLDASLVFDHPTPAAVAAHLRTLLLPRPRGTHGTTDPLTAQLDRLEAALAALDQDDIARLGVLPRLRDVLTRYGNAAPGIAAPDGAPLADRLQQATDEQLFSMVDQDLGID